DLLPQSRLSLSVVSAESRQCGDSARDGGVDRTRWVPALPARYPGLPNSGASRPVAGSPDPCARHTPILRSCPPAPMLGNSGVTTSRAATLPERGDIPAEQRL